MEIVLTTLPVPAKGDLKGKGLEASEATLTQSTKAPAKDKIVVKKKQFLKQLFFFFKKKKKNVVFVSRICNEFDFF